MVFDIGSKAETFRGYTGTSGDIHKSHVESESLWLVTLRDPFTESARNLRRTSILIVFYETLHFLS